MIPGEIFGCWETVSKIYDGTSQSKRIWQVRCTICGREKKYSERQLLSLRAARAALGRATVRGCEKGCRTQRIDVKPGDVYGLWTVLEGEPQRYLTTLKYPVVCVCGHRQLVTIASLRRGRSGKGGGSSGCRSCRNKK